MPSAQFPEKQGTSKGERNGRKQTREDGSWCDSSDTFIRGTQRAPNSKLGDRPWNYKNKSTS